jgi:hypothetical protein
MKRIIFLLSLAAVVLFFSCDQGIDSIKEVAPGHDMAPPVVAIDYPAAGLEIQVKEDVVPITIKFEVEDDIELNAVVVSMDGSVIGNYSDFKDYRKFAVDDLVYPNLENGDHSLSVSATDIEGKETTQTISFVKKEAYKPRYDGEIFYMPFNGDFAELVSVTSGTAVGSIGFAGESVLGPNALAGAVDSYVSFPTEGILFEEISATFWYKLNAIPDRAGILVIGPQDTENPDAQNNRTSGFRFFREGANGNQRFKLNVGNGTADSWVDGGAAADLAPGTDWVQMAFTISGSAAKVYIDGTLVAEAAITGVDWTGCDLLSIGSGAPRFTGWGHLSDLSFIDELRIYNKALTIEEILEIQNADLQ